MAKKIRLYCMVMKLDRSEIKCLAPEFTANTVAEAQFMLERNAERSGLLVLSVLTEAQVDNKIKEKLRLRG